MAFVELQVLTPQTGPAGVVAIPRRSPLREGDRRKAQEAGGQDGNASDGQDESRTRARPRFMPAHSRASMPATALVEDPTALRSLSICQHRTSRNLDMVW